MKTTRYLVLLLVAGAALMMLGACSDDDDDGASSGGTSAPDSQASSEICDDLDVLREDLESVRQSILSGDFAAAQDSIEAGRTKAAAIREDLRDPEPSAAASQSAADLIGAVDGLETTLRQIGQGGGSPQGVIQELQIQLGAMVSSFNSLITELRC
jgi:hypothetical protein